MKKLLASFFALALAAAPAWADGPGPLPSLKIGTASGTAAAGNDSRIAGALQSTGGTMTGALQLPVMTLMDPTARPVAPRMVSDAFGIGPSIYQKLPSTGYEMSIRQADGTNRRVMYFQGITDPQATNTYYPQPAGVPIQDDDNWDFKGANFTFESANQLVLSQTFTVQGTADNSRTGTKRLTGITLTSSNATGYTAGQVLPIVFDIVNGTIPAPTTPAVATIRVKQTSPGSGIYTLDTTTVTFQNHGAGYPADLTHVMAYVASPASSARDTAPVFTLYHNYGPGHSGDFNGVFQWQANDSAGKAQNQGQFLAVTDSATAGAYSSHLTLFSGYGNEFSLGNGMYVDGNTGPQGRGTIYFPTILAKKFYVTPGIAFASLPSGQGAGVIEYCTDCISANSNGSAGALVVANGSGVWYTATGPATTASGAYSRFTPTLSCAFGSVNSGSGTGSYKIMGKTLFYHMALSITKNGSCAGAIYVTMPVAAVIRQYAGGGIEENVTTKGVTVNVNTSGVAAIRNSADGSYPGGNGYLFDVSGNYETQ